MWICGTDHNNSFISVISAITSKDLPVSKQDIKQRCNYYRENCMTELTFSHPVPRFGHSLKSVKFCLYLTPLEMFSISCRPACNFIKKKTLAQVLSCEFCETFKNTYFSQNTSGGCWVINTKQKFTSSYSHLHQKNVFYNKRILTISLIFYYIYF